MRLKKHEQKTEYSNSIYHDANLSELPVCGMLKIKRIPDFNTEFCFFGLTLHYTGKLLSQLARVLTESIISKR